MKKPIYCPSCKQRFEPDELKQFIDHALEMHGRLYHSKPQGENFDITIR